MQHLDAINPQKGIATDAMVLFLAINTSSVTLLPTGVIALRAAAGSADPAGIIPTTLFATICSTGVAIVLARLCRGWTAAERVPSSHVIPERDIAATGEEALASGTSSTEGVPPGGSVADARQQQAAASGYPLPVSLSVLGGVVLLLPLTILYGRDVAPWLIPVLVVGLLLFGAGRGVRVYEAFIEGARDGFPLALRIVPYLVAILVAVGMLRASGALDLLIQPLGTVTSPFGLPAEGLLMGLLRALSGSGAYAYLASILNDPQHGPDSYTGYLVSTIQGSTETTFYVLAVYFGAVGVRRMRHALFVGLAADVTGVAASVLICWILHGRAIQL
jgi:spore maturation protein SpmB